MRSVLRLPLLLRFTCLALFPPLCHVPVVHSCECNLQCLRLVVSHELKFPKDGPTVICSLKKSRSSSHVARLAFAVDSFDVSNSTASGIGYASMTFAPSHRYTSSVGGTSAFAKRVSLSSNVVSMGSASVPLVLRKRTVSSVFWMSGILSFSPAARRCVFACMNWYFLAHCVRLDFDWSEWRCVRDHLFEAVDGAFDFGAVGDIVLNAIDERRLRNASWVRFRLPCALSVIELGDGRRHTVQASPRPALWCVEINFLQGIYKARVRNARDRKRRVVLVNRPGAKVVAPGSINASVCGVCVCCKLVPRVSALRLLAVFRSTPLDVPGSLPRGYAEPDMQRANAGPNV